MNRIIATLALAAPVAWQASAETTTIAVPQGSGTFPTIELANRWQHQFAPAPERHDYHDLLAELIGESAKAGREEAGELAQLSWKK